MDNWNEDWEEGRFFITLKNGDNIGFDADVEEYSLNNYWNTIGQDEAEELINKWGIDHD
jgi:hypothetical protein